MRPTAIRTWNIWCDWPQRSNHPGRQASGILVCGPFQHHSHERLGKDEFDELTYSVNSDGRKIHKYRDSISCRSGLNVHLFIPMNETGIDDRIESRRGHERKEETSKRAPCWLSESAHEEHENGCEYLGGEIELVKNPKA